MPSEIWTSAAPKVTQLLWMPWSTCVPKSIRWPKVCRGHDGPCAACVLEADGFKPDMAPAEGFKPDERVYAYRIVSGVRAQPYRGVGQKTASLGCCPQITCGLTRRRRQWRQWMRSRSTGKPVANLPCARKNSSRSGSKNSSTNTSISNLPIGGAVGPCAASPPAPATFNRRRECRRQGDQRSHVA